MIHHRQRLSLGLEPGDDTPRVHAKLDYLDRHATPDRFQLFGDINHATTAFSELFPDFVRADNIAGLLRRWNTYHHRPGSAWGNGGLQKSTGPFVRSHQDFKVIS